MPALVGRHQALGQEVDLEFCADNGIGAFRINSQILPVYTHPDVGYDLFDLPDGDRIVARFLGAEGVSQADLIRIVLDQEEFAVMRSHARLGAEILMEHKTATPLDVAAAWGHHLRHDGGGYPGPRCTPTYYRDNIYALGLSGDLVCLNATNGSGKTVLERQLVIGSRRCLVRVLRHVLYTPHHLPLKARPVFTASRTLPEGPLSLPTARKRKPWASRFST